MKLLEREIQRLKMQEYRAKRSKAKMTLTIDEWSETLEYFNYSCAYCGNEFEVIEHYIPLRIIGSGTTIDNCVPSCHICNARKDAYGKQHLRYYENQKVVDYLQSRGAKIYFHEHKYDCMIESYVGLNYGLVRIFCKCGEFYQLINATISDAKEDIKIKETERLGIVSFQREIDDD